jgi:hypothetical protein
MPPGHRQAPGRARARPRAYGRSDPLDCAIEPHGRPRCEQRDRHCRGDRERLMPSTMPAELWGAGVSTRAAVARPCALGSAFLGRRPCRPMTRIAASRVAAGRDVWPVFGLPSPGTPGADRRLCPWCGFGAAGPGGLLPNKALARSRRSQQPLPRPGFAACCRVRRGAGSWLPWPETRALAGLPGRRWTGVVPCPTTSYISNITCSARSRLRITHELRPESGVLALRRRLQRKALRPCA